MILCGSKKEGHGSFVVSKEGTNNDKKHKMGTKRYTRLFVSEGAPKNEDRAQKVCNTNRREEHLSVSAEGIS